MTVLSLMAKALVGPLGWVLAATLGWPAVTAVAVTVTTAAGGFVEGYVTCWRLHRRPSVAVSLWWMRRRPVREDVQMVAGDRKPFDWAEYDQ